MQFTERYIQSLKPKASRYDKREKSGEGFAVRVSPQGEKTWVFFYAFEGKKRRMSLGRYPHMSLAVAREEHRKALTILANGRDPGLLKITQKQAAKDSWTVTELIDEYIKEWALERKRSWKEDQRLLDKDVRPFWGKRKVEEITRRDVVLLLDRIKNRGAPIGANRALACVRRMFGFAVERSMLVSTPCSHVKAPSKENRRERCLSDDEIRKLWVGLEQAPVSISTKLILKLQLVTAQRKGEIVSVESNEIDLNNGWWVIPGEKAKNGQMHRVPLSKLAIELFQQAELYKKESKWVFPSPKTKKKSRDKEDDSETIELIHDKSDDEKIDNHIRGEAVDHAVRRCEEMLKEIKHFTPHDLRRTAASHMTSLGVSRLVVSKVLNHVERGVTAVYDRHSYDAEKRYALDVWSSQLAQILNDELPENNVVLFKEVV